MAVSTRDSSLDEGDFFTPEDTGNDRKFRLPKLPKRGRQPAGDWLDNFEEVPRDELPDGQQLARRARWTKWYLLTCAVVAPLLLLSTFLLVAQPPPTPPEVEGSGLNQVRAEAQAVVEQWIASDASPITGAHLLGYSSTERLPKAKPNPSNPNQDNVRLDSVRFLVLKPKSETLSTAQVLAVEVLMASTKDGAVSAMTTPALLPTTPTFATSTNRWPALPSVTSASEEATVAIKTWATAMTSGSAQDVRAAVSDPSPKHVYVPFVGLELRDVNVEEAAVVQPGADTDAAPKKIVVAVTLVLTDRLNCDDCNDSNVEFDVLIHGADGVNPHVVAWGAPGTGPTLTAYKNALGASKALSDALATALSEHEGILEGQEAPKEVAEEKKPADDKPSPDVASDSDPFGGN